MENSGDHAFGVTGPFCGEHADFLGCASRRPNAEPRGAGRRSRHAHVGAHRAGPAAGQLDWISRLRAPPIKALLDAGAFQPSLFDERDLASSPSADFPGERLIVCRNPELAVARRASARICLPQPSGACRHRQRPLAAPASRCAVRPRSPSRSAPSSTSTRWPSTSTLDDHRHRLHLCAQARGDRRRGALDGLYVIRTSLPAEALDDAARARLQEPGPGRARLPLHEDRRPARAPGLPLATPSACAPMSSCACSPTTSSGTCAQRLAPMLYDDADKQAAEALRTSVVAKAQRSPSALAKQSYGTTPTAFPSTASTACSPTSQLSPGTRWQWLPATITSSSCTPLQPSSSRRLSISSA